MRVRKESTSSVDGDSPVLRAPPRSAGGASALPVQCQHLPVHGSAGAPAPGGGRQRTSRATREWRPCGAGRGPRSAPRRPWRAWGCTRRVRLVRGEGRDVPGWYGVRDAACPLSTRGGRGGGRAARAAAECSWSAPTSPHAPPLRARAPPLRGTPPAPRASRLSAPSHSASARRAPALGASAPRASRPGELSPGMRWRKQACRAARQQRGRHMTPTAGGNGSKDSNGGREWLQGLQRREGSHRAKGRVLDQPARGVLLQHLSPRARRVGPTGARAAPRGPLLATRRAGRAASGRYEMAPRRGA